MATPTPMDALVASLCRPLGFSYGVRPIAMEETGGPEPGLSSAEEALRLALRSPKRRREFTAGRLAAKEALRKAVFFDCREGPIDIGRKASGAPKSPRDGIYLSISHSGCVAVAVAAPYPVGVDVEQGDPRPPSLARYFFSSREQTFLARKGAKESATLVNRLWSRKEAVAKVGEWGGRLVFREIDCVDNTVWVEGRVISLSSGATERFVVSIAYDKEYR